MIIKNSLSGEDVSLMPNESERFWNAQNEKKKTLANTNTSEVFPVLDY